MRVDPPENGFNYVLQYLDDIKYPDARGQHSLAHLKNTFSSEISGSTFISHYFYVAEK